MLKHHNFLIVFVLLMYLQSGCYVKSQYNLVIHQDDIKVYLHDTWQDSHSYKAEGLINQPIDTVFQFLISLENYCNWISYCTESKVLSMRNENYYLYYMYYDLPWPLTDRDAIAEMRISELNDGSILTRVNAFACKKYQSPGVIRVNAFSEEYHLISTSKNTTLMKMQGTYHPGGYLPDWLVRKFLTWGPYDTLLKIRDEIGR